MSIFDKFKHDIQQAFHPVEQAVQQFDSHHVAEVLTSAIAEPVRAKLPGHLSLHEAAELVALARPSSIDCDLFVGFGLSLGVELELEFAVGVTWDNPEEVIGGIVGIVENPPERVHGLLDQLWAIKPAEIRVYERLQAVVGEQVQLRWNGDDVMERVVEYIGKRGWLEHKLRP